MLFSKATYIHSHARSHTDSGVENSLGLGVFLFPTGLPRPQDKISSEYPV